MEVSMSFDTTPQRLQPAPASVPGLAELELDEIQGDVLIGLQKNYERFVFFNIARVADFKSLLRKKITNRITTTSTVHAREHQLRDYKTSGGKDPLPLVGLNLALTNTGIAKLVPGVNLGDPSFAQGAAKSAANLGDPVNEAKDPTGWKPAFASQDIDGVFLVTGGTKAAVDGEVNLILGILGAAVVVVFDQTGHVRPDFGERTRTLRMAGRNITTWRQRDQRPISWSASPRSGSLCLWVPGAAWCASSHLDEEWLPDGVPAAQPAGAGIQ